MSEPAATTSPDPSPPPDRRTRAVLLGGLHLGALWALAVAQPLFSVLEKTPEFFSVRASPAVDIILFSILLVLVPPLLLTLIELIAALVSRPLQLGLHYLFFSAGVALLALELIGSSLAGGLAIAASVAAGIAAAAAYARSGAVRSFMTLLSPAPVVFLVLFLFISPISKLVLPDTVQAASARVSAKNSPVVFVTFDEFPMISLLNGHGRIDATRFPNFARLAGDSTWFRGYTTNGAYTTLAVPTILTGTTKRGPEDQARNVFTLLARSDRLNVTEVETNICPDSLCHRKRDPLPARLGSLTTDLGVVTGHIVLPPDLRGGIPSIQDRWQNFAGANAEVTGSAPASAGDTGGKGDRPSGQLPGAERTTIFLKFLRSLTPRPGRPALDFLHSEYPHRNWIHLPSGTRYNGLDMPGLDGDQWTKDPWPVEQADQRHLAQVVYTDRLLGLMIDRLKRLGIYDKAAIVITADHGASFIPGTRRRAARHDNLQEVGAPPLFIKAPGQRRGVIVDKHVQQIDILPSLADVLGIQVPWKLPGQSAFSKDYRPSPRLDVLTAPQRTVTESFMKFKVDFARSLRYQSRTFFPGTGPATLFRLGPHPELIGRSTSALGATSAAGQSVSLADANLYTNVRAGSDFVPAFVHGQISGAGQGGQRDLAVALNGRIVAVTKTYKAPDGARFAALVPQSAFRSGRNQVSVFEVSGSSGSLSLARLSG